MHTTVRSGVASTMDLVGKGGVPMRKIGKRWEDRVSWEREGKKIRKWGGGVLISRMDNALPCIIYLILMLLVHFVWLIWAFCSNNQFLYFDPSLLQFSYLWSTNNKLKIKFDCVSLEKKNCELRYFIFPIFSSTKQVQKEEKLNQRKKTVNEALSQKSKQNNKN